MTDGFAVPASFLAMPRWWSEGQEWLADLPRLVTEQCRQWQLHVVGEAMHGSNAIAVPVVRDGEELVLRLNPPGDDVARHVSALRFWAGRCTVLLIDADLDSGAMLLERLGPSSLRDRTVEEAVDVLGAMMRRLAVPAPAWAPSTADRARTRAAELEQRWDGAVDRAFLDEALRVADALSHTDSDLACNADLHSDQVLGGRREQWLAVDPVLLRGDIEFDLARLLWTRLDEMPDEATILALFERAVAQAAVGRDRARDWVVFRTVDYWLWGLGKGLTEDPLRCHRLARVFVG
jgi:streptomycin 6-kinase